ncbi:hypothetical protein HA38_13080 [Pantoea allii]|nr:hypothetical protein HA38_13080 [Pantoea allii]PBK00580.1 hypothetical protein CMR03_09465 [Pantoea allii]
MTKRQVLLTLLLPRQRWRESLLHQNALGRQDDHPCGESPWIARLIPICLFTSSTCSPVSHLSHRSLFWLDTQQIAIAVLSLSIPLLTLRRLGGKRDPPDVLRRQESAMLPNAANIPYLPQVNLCDKDHIN